MTLIERHLGVKSSQINLYGLKFMLVLYVILILAVILYLFLSTLNGEDSTFFKVKMKFSSYSAKFSKVFGIDNDKIILDWHGFFGSKITKESWMLDCPDFPCSVTNDKSATSKASAVVFHIRGFRWDDVPKERLDWQRYVFMLLENPYFTGQDNLTQIPGFFNWTLTYRLDSDIPMPYGYIDYSNESINDPYAFNAARSEENLERDRAAMRTAISNKTNYIVWFVSHCATPSKREVFISNLNKSLPVHVYGACGWRNCSRAQWAECDQMLEDRYWFFFAGENAICKDYITEKLWSRVTKWTVPIVLKRAIYAEKLPHNAFIAADDFANTKLLADHLKFLVENKGEYEKYFNWKFQTFAIHINPSFRAGRESGFCKLCEHLWNSDLPKKCYHDMHKWWVDDAHCERDFLWV